MTALLSRIFVKDYQNTSNPDVRSAYGKMAGWVGIVCNLLLCAGKFLAGMLSGSVSITADALNNLSDASSSIISLLGFKLAESPADEEHPYGHARYEYLAGLVVAVLVLVIGVELLKSSISRIIEPSPVDFTLLSAVILLASVAVKLWMMLFNRKIGKKISSETLLATSADSRNDVISTLAVLTAAVISHFTAIELDGFMGLAVAVFILISGLGLVRDAMSPLLGKAPEPEFVREIRSRISEYDGVLGIHDLMIHDYGPGRNFVTVHVEMAAERPSLECHDIIDTIERDFLRDGIHLLVHFDPIVTADPRVREMAIDLQDFVKTLDSRLSVHDVRIVPGTNITALIFDCVVPHKFPMTEQEIRQEIVRHVEANFSGYACIITFEKSYVSE